MLITLKKTTTNVISKKYDSIYFIVFRRAPPWEKEELGVV
jgi:hypothetical protein